MKVCISIDMDNYREYQSLVDPEGDPLTTGGADVQVAPLEGTTPSATVGSVTDNGDGTYTLMTYGTSGEGGGPVGHYLTMEAFMRDSHEGTALAFEGAQFNYNVVRLQ